MTAESSGPEPHLMDDHVLGQIGLHVPAEGDACGPGMHLHLSPVLFEDDGHLDFGVLGAFLDMASSQAVPLRPFVHADISIHRIAKPTGERLVIDARPLREGKRTSIVHVAVHDEHGVHVADSTQQIVNMPMPEDRLADPERGAAERARFFSRFDGVCRLPRRLHEMLGIAEEVDDDGTRSWTMPLGPMSRNGFGGLHGGVAFDLVTEAAVAAASHASGPVQAKSTLLRYLDRAMVGPFRAVPAVMSQGDGSVYARVEVLDDGADGLRCIVGEVHLAPTPATP